MNSKQIMDRTWFLVTDHVRQQLTETTKASVVTDRVRKELESDDGRWIRKAMEQLGGGKGESL